jgi:hypothetical protein
MDYRRQLIDLYANHEASAAKTVPQYQQLYAQHANDMQFCWLREQIEQIKISVEQRLETAASPTEQLREVIRMLREYRKHEIERGLFYDLVVAMYATSWGATRIAYLNEALAAVRLTRDYFLSFTTRHSATVNVNPVNARYKYLIRDVLQNGFKTANQKDNLFAEAINQIFSQKANGYFFPKSEDGTSIVVDELARELNQCFVFVQIIQTEMFELAKDTNYCFWEWTHAMSRFGNAQHHLVYILGEDNRDWLDLPPDVDFVTWHGHVKAKKVPPTPLLRVYNASGIERTKQSIETILRRDILGAWTRLELAAP